MVIEINRLSLNSEGAFLTIIHKRIPQSRNKNSTRKEEGQHSHFSTQHNNRDLTDGKGMIPPIRLAQESLEMI